MADALKINQMRHPEYVARLQDWWKWRLVYQGGDEFVEEYLTRFSKRERNSDFQLRKQVTPIPTFGKAAVNDVKNSVFQRMTDISRQGGPQSYQQAVAGIGPGVDQRGSTMNAFVGQNLLPELLTMSRVGIYVDKAPLVPGASLIDAAKVQPYLYMYRVEDICSWACRNQEEPDNYQAILLKDRCIEYDPVNYLASGQVERYRHLWIDRESGYVNVQFYNKDGGMIARDGTPGGMPEVLNLKTIPFVMLDIRQSLLEDVANHQIALLNLGSSDVAYALKSNFPFYIEQDDLRSGTNHLKDGQNPDGSSITGGQAAADQEITVGPVQGRKYNLKANAPSFINPSSEPLEASIKLQEKLKEDIRLLVNLAVTNINPKMASAESKTIDQQGLESGLSYIGLVLENGERAVARYWAQYEAGSAATVKYPEKYSLKSEAERRAEAKDHAALMFTAPSRTFQRQIAKDIINILQGSKVSVEELEKMLREVDAAAYLTSDPDIVINDLNAGLVGPELASEARGYPEGEVEKAQKAAEERATAIAQAQAKGNPGSDGLTNPGARGVPDLAIEPNQGSKEKEGKPKRGPAAGIKKE